MKKVRTIIILSVMLFVLAGSSFGIGNTHVLASPPKPVTVKTEKYNDLNEVKYPQISEARNKTAEAKINKALFEAGMNGFTSYEEYEKKEKEFKSESPEICKESPLMCDFTSTTTYRAHYNNGSYLSIMFYTYVYAGGAHGNQLLNAYNYNMSTGKQVYLKDILNTPKKLKKTKNYIVNAVVKAKPHLKGLTAKDIDFGDTNFVYNTKGITIVFNEYSIGPYADGNIIVAVPKSVYK